MSDKNFTSKSFMNEIKERWGDKLLSFDDFNELVKDKKVVDLSSGEYVNKYSIAEIERVYKEKISSLESSNKEKIEPIEMSKKIDAIKSNYEVAIKDMKSHIDMLHKETLIKDSISEAGGNADIILALMKGRGDIDKIIYNAKDNSITGITDILSSYKTNTNTANLFITNDSVVTTNDKIATTAAASNINEFETELNKARKGWGLIK